MKNGHLKNSLWKIKTTKDFIKSYTQTNKDETYKVLSIIFFGLILSLLIQDIFTVKRFIGSFLLISIILFIFYKDVKRYKPAYSKDFKMLLLLGVLMTATIIFSQFSFYINEAILAGLNFPQGDSYVYGAPIPVGSMLVTLIFDFHTAIIFSFIISLIAGIWLNEPFFLVYSFIGSLTAAFSAVRCKKRSSLVKGGLYISLANIITVTIIFLIKEDFLSPVNISALFFAVTSGIIVAAIVLMVLPLIEYLFGVTTDISLVELLDLDHPLMRSLMINAPGTYHHSVIVASLAGAAAEAVGANPLLARVSAYYHDIGKIKMPEYYIENQTSSVSKHDKLTPHMSSMIIMSHVKEGVELARQYKLPQSVINILQQHHGTSSITFFYQKAKEQVSDSPPAIEDYRYHGPKPQSRVAALVMMADAVEAASRSLIEPTPARISSLVDKIINNIFLDGQIDECELTLKDLSEIKKRFTHILTIIFHKRIAYPDFTDKDLTQKKQKPLFSTSNIGQYSKESVAVPSKSNGNIDFKQTKTDKDKPSEDKETIKEGT
ncbi:MAG: HDIG domain-containing protein [Thermodesulfovibrionales bacterium]|nr:HDIG domain-containing protein [Thermodesulfovibrionales bacterium]